MTRLSLTFCVLVSLIPLTVAGQQLPGRWENQMPGQQQCAGQNSEIANLKQYSETQRNKIALLEEKVKLLQAKLEQLKN